MTEVLRERGRDVGGYDRFHDRSRSRGHVIEPRGEKYGRENIRGDKPNAGPDQDMHRGGGGGGYRDRPSDSRGGDRDGYRDRPQGGGGRGGDFRGGRGGYGGGGAGGFQQSGPKVATVAEGQTSNLHSNHFKFVQS